MSSAVLQHLLYSVFMNNNKPIRFVENVNQTFGKEAFQIEKRDGVMCLIGPDVNSYREYFGEEVYTFECTKEDLPWAFAQFGMEYISE